MNNETASGPAGTPDRPGHPGGGSGEQSPLQARAQFLKNRGWEFVISLNRGACARGGAQHGFNSETHNTLATEWEVKGTESTSLEETIDFLCDCHRRAPFLFFNGNTFADVGRQIGAALFADLPSPRRREVTSAIAHCIAGVLDRASMIEIVESLCHSAELKPGDRVKTLRGSMQGTVRSLLADGRVVWQPDEIGSELTALPESLSRIDKSSDEKAR